MVMFMETMIRWQYEILGHMNVYYSGLVVGLVFGIFMTIVVNELVVKPIRKKYRNFKNKNGNNKKNHNKW